MWTRPKGCAIRYMYSLVPNATHVCWHVSCDTSLLLYHYFKFGVMSIDPICHFSSNKVFEGTVITIKDVCSNLYSPGKEDNTVSYVSIFASFILICDDILPCFVYLSPTDSNFLPDNLGSWHEGVRLCSRWYNYWNKDESLDRVRWSRFRHQC